METIRIYVTKNVATCERRTAIVCGNTDYQIEFVLDDEWSAYPNRMARFIWNGQYQDVSFTGNTCMMPPVYNTEKCYVGLIAEGYQQITTAAVISCKKSVKCIETQPSTEQFIHDVLNTDVPNDADDELSLFLSELGVSIGAAIGSSNKINPQDFSRIIGTMLARKTENFTYNSSTKPAMDNTVERFTVQNNDVYAYFYKVSETGRIANISAGISNWAWSSGTGYGSGDGYVLPTEYLADGVSWVGYGQMWGANTMYIGYFDAPGEYLIPNDNYLNAVTVPSKGLYLALMQTDWGSDYFSFLSFDIFV